MRKWIYLWTVVCTILVACDVETSDNGRLDGYWHLTGVDTLATSGHRDVSEETIFWAVQFDLIQLKGADRQGVGREFYARFDRQDGHLTLTLANANYASGYTLSNNNGTIVKADRPADLFRNSIATPSLVATIMTGKYLNHLPLERQSRCLKDNGIQLETNTLANWMMEASDRYLRIIYDKLHKDLYDSHVVHADETPFEVIRDGRPAGRDSFMWVYRNGACDAERRIAVARIVGEVV